MNASIIDYMDRAFLNNIALPALFSYKKNNYFVKLSGSTSCSIGKECAPAVKEGATCNYCDGCGTCINTCNNLLDCERASGSLTNLYAEVLTSVSQLEN